MSAIQRVDVLTGLCDFNLEAECEKTEERIEIGTTPTNITPEFQLRKVTSSQLALNCLIEAAVRELHTSARSTQYISTEYVIPMAPALPMAHVASAHNEQQSPDQYNDFRETELLTPNIDLEVSRAHPAVGAAPAIHWPHEEDSKRIYECNKPNCAKAFTVYSIYLNHIRSHRQDRRARNFKCPYDGCGRSYLDQGSLDKHIITHTGERNFKCELCESAFFYNSHLKRHMRIHSGERPYSCPEPGCNKAFARSDDLSSHKRVHTGEKPYVCRVCNKAFTQSTTLRRHLLSKHNDEKVWVPCA